MTLIKPAITRGRNSFKSGETTTASVGRWTNQNIFRNLLYFSIWPSFSFFKRPSINSLNTLLNWWRWCLLAEICALINPRTFHFNLKGWDILNIVGVFVILAFANCLPSRGVNPEWRTQMLGFTPSGAAPPSLLPPTNLIFIFPQHLMMTTVIQGVPSTKKLI